MTQENDNIIPYKFTARPYQVPFLSAVQDAIEGRSKKRFFYIIWHRRSGKDKSCIADVAPRRLIQDTCLVNFIYPTLVMGRENLWDGIGSDGFRYRDHIPEFMRDGKPNDTTMKIRVQNGSLFQVKGSDHPDSLRGGNPKMDIFSEWAEQDPYAWDVVEPILQENKGIAIFNTTPKGENHARALHDYAKTDPEWFVQTLTVDHTGIFSKEDMKRIREKTTKRFVTNGRSEEEANAYIDQEYYCSFDSPVLGAYYGAAINRAESDGRITHVPYDVGLQVHTCWDLGIDDSMSIWFFQLAGREFHFIDYYENSGEGLPHYAQILQEKKYIYGRHIGPHDLAVRELGTGKSRQEIAEGLGINFEIAPRLSVDEGISAVRTVLGRCWFDVNKCARGISAMKNYKKDWNEKNMVYRRGPLHNWASHGADSFRMFATGFSIPQTQETQGNVGGVEGASGIDGLI